MNLVAGNVDELCAALAACYAEGRKVVSVDLSPLGQIRRYAPEDLTVSVEGGMMLGALQAALARHSQWLPLDPVRMEALTISDLISRNLHGPRRYGYGTVREHLIGLTVVLADGRVIHSGGQVVKNVAGYDLCKLFVGSHGTLGVIVEASFKLLPLPESEVFLGRPQETLETAYRTVEAVFASPLTPVVLDLHRLAEADEAILAPVSVVLGLAGTKEEVSWQQEQARLLGFTEMTTLDYERRFWTLSPGGAEPVSLSVLPSRLVYTLKELGEVPWLARAGNGLVWFRGTRPATDGRLPLALMRRIKQTFDPKSILAELPW